MFSIPQPCALWLHTIYKAKYSLQLAGNITHHWLHEFKTECKEHVSIIWPVTSNINLITVAVNAIHFQRHSDLAHNPSADYTLQCYDLLYQYMYSDLSVSTASQEMEEHLVRKRRTDVHMNQPAGSHRRHLWTAVMSITFFLFFCCYTLWARNSLTISILTLSKSLTCCQHLCSVAIQHEVWNYVQKSHTTQ